MNGPRACFTCGKGLTRHRLQAHAWLFVIQHDGSGYLFCPGDCADAELDRIDPSDRAYLVMPGPRLVELCHWEDAAGRPALRKIVL